MPPWAEDLLHEVRGFRLANDVTARDVQDGMQRLECKIDYLLGRRSPSRRSWLITLAISLMSFGVGVWAHARIGG